MKNVQYIIENINEYTLWIAVGLLVVSFISLILIINNIILSKRLKKLTRGVKNKNLYEILEKYFDEVDQSKHEMSSKIEEIKGLTEKVNTSIHKTNLVRYKAFEDVGGDLSFSLALLDSSDNGVLITSIFGRSHNTVYAKQIENGKTKYELSDEEKEALNGALSK